MKRKQSACSLFVLLLSAGSIFAAENVIERQLEDIGSIPNEEVVVVQRKYTRKIWRSEFSPISFGGVPFGTVRRTLVAGASYTLHANDWLAFELLNFQYTKNFFSSFTSDVNANKDPGRVSTQPDIKPDYQKLLYFLTTGLEVTPFYGKLSSFSRWIGYVEPYLSLGVGLAKTEVNSYITYYPGVGVRAFFREWFSMRLEFRDYLYTEKFVDRTTLLTTPSLRNNFAVMVSLSFWLPKMP